MFSKLLLTALLLAVAIALFRARARAPRPGHASEEPSPAGALSPRHMAYTAIAVIVTVSTMVAYLQWGAGQAIVEVRVVDTRGGGAETYRAREEQVGKRVFTTLDGRRIRVADTERIEVRSLD